MKTPLYKEALTKAKEFETEFFRSTERENFAVQVVYDDGTVLFYNNAVVRDWNDWFFIYSDNYGIPSTMVCHQSHADVNMFQRVWDIETLENMPCECDGLARNSTEIKE